MLCVANGQSRARVVFIQNKRIRRFAVNTTRCSPPLVLMTMKSLFAFHEIFSLSLGFFFSFNVALARVYNLPKNSSVCFTHTRTSVAGASTSL